MKKYLFGLMALLFVVAVSAFTTTKSSKTTDGEVWFEYDPVNGNGPTDPANYIETGMDPECEDEEGTLCSVFAEPDPATGDPGERKPLAASLTAIANGPGFDDYVLGQIHFRD